ncbi:hypothetical protein AHiyo4_38600 [Arthrobacter sp. Hiyo4]|nr:hypothetical protein AHiyo4_38600 [Arthrobacter sp. Hiyo4]
MRQSCPEADAYGSGALDLPHEAPLLGRGPQAHAGGEHQFAAAEETLRVLELRDGNPVDVLVPGGLGKARIGQMEGVHAEQGGEGNGHGSRIDGRWATALNIAAKGVQVAIPRGKVLA